MPYKKDMKIKFDFPEHGIDEVVAESGNTIVRLKEVSWNGRPAKLEVRKWRMSSNGEETPAQGLTFANEDIAHSLVNTMTKIGLGHTSTVLKNLSSRADFNEALVQTIGKEKVIQAQETEFTRVIGKDDYYDPRSMMGL